MDKNLTSGKDIYRERRDSSFVKFINNYGVEYA